MPENKVTSNQHSVYMVYSVVTNQRMKYIDATKQLHSIVPIATFL